MSTRLVKAATIVTMSPEWGDQHHGALFIEDGMIKQMGAVDAMPPDADYVDDLSRYAIYPGLVNTHHHFYQTLTRALPAAQNVGLFDWLKTLYPIWGRITADDIFVSTQTALAELAVSGCTTAADHLYIFPNGSRLDDEIQAGEAVGLRLHLSRGCMTLGESQGGLPPDYLTERQDIILKDTLRLIEQYHDPSAASRLRIVIAPCSPFSVTADIMKESAKMADEYQVGLHTHLAETVDEDQFCRNKFGCRPIAYMERLGWLDSKAWFAHGIFVNNDEIKQLASHQCGVAHCPSSNMRLASGIAPIVDYLRAGVKVGLGVDGSASNDGSNMMAELRQGFLLARLAASASVHRGQAQASPLLDARQALWLATQGGAKVLGRDDIGCLEPGKCADFFALNLDRLEYAGVQHDPAAIPAFMSCSRVDKSYVGGQLIVDQGRLLTLDERKITEAHNRAATRLLNQ